MLSEILSGVGGLAVGALGGLVASFTEPIQSRFRKLGRTAVSDPGVDTHIEVDPQIIWAGMPNWIPFQFFFPGSIPHEAPPPDAKAWRNWAISHGGLDSGESIVRVSVVSRGSATVVLETPIVTCTTEAAPQGQRAIHPVGGAAIQPTAFYVDLDMFGPDYPEVHLLGEQGDDIKQPLTWSVGEGEAETVLIRVRSKSALLIRWKARMPLLIDGKRRYIEVVDDSGGSFVFAGSGAGDDDYFYRFGNAPHANWTARGS